MGDRPLPWSATCFVCGDENVKGLNAKFRVGDDGRVVLETTVDHGFEGFGGHVHGGVVTAMLDEAAGWAVMHALQRLCMTVEITIRFKRPVVGGSKVKVVAESLGAEGRFQRARAEMSDASGKPLAVAVGRFVAVPEEMHQRVVPLLKMPGRPAEPSDI
jgi:uncharacterized protein (TIGR00369 family)